ncbi:hypothetical protein V3C99_000777 [Haemonchus contortus]
MVPFALPCTLSKIFTSVFAVLPMLCLVVVLLLLVPFSSQADIFSLMKAQPLHNYFKTLKTFSQRSRDPYGYGAYRFEDNANRDMLLR